MSMNHFVIHIMLMYLVNILSTKGVVTSSLANVTKWIYTGKQIVELNDKQIKR